jgi:hypothetical protein
MERLDSALIVWMAGEIFLQSHSLVVLAAMLGRVGFAMNLVAKELPVAPALLRMLVDDLPIHLTPHDHHNGSGYRYYKA